jgi:hypothetical protein
MISGSPSATIRVPNFGLVIFLLTAGDLVCLRVLGEDSKEGVIIVCRSLGPLTDYLFILPKANHTFLPKLGSHRLFLPKLGPH